MGLRLADRAPKLRKTNCSGRRELTFNLFFLSVYPSTSLGRINALARRSRNPYQAIGRTDQQLSAPTVRSTSSAAPASRPAAEPHTDQDEEEETNTLTRRGRDPYQAQ